MNHSLFNRSLVVEYLDGFQSFTAINDAYVNNLVPMFFLLWEIVSDRFLEMGLLGHRIKMHIIL